MKLVNYTPFNEFNRIARSMNGMFGDDIFGMWNSARNEQWLPAVDIRSEDDTVFLTMDLPGMKKDEINIKMENRVLTIEGERRVEEKKEGDQYYQVERRHGKFSRSFTLSEKISMEEVDAKYEDGVLTISLKKEAPEESIKQIAIQ